MAVDNNFGLSLGSLFEEPKGVDSGIQFVNSVTAAQANNANTITINGTTYGPGQTITVSVPVRDGSGALSPVTLTTEQAIGIVGGGTNPNFSILHGVIEGSSNVDNDGINGTVYTKVQLSADESGNISSKGLLVDGKTAVVLGSNVENFVAARDVYDAASANTQLSINSSSALKKSQSVINSITNGNTSPAPSPEAINNASGQPVKVGLTVNRAPTNMTPGDPELGPKGGTESTISAANSGAGSVSNSVADNIASASGDIIVKTIDQSGNTKEAEASYGKNVPIGTESITVGDQFIPAKSAAAILGIVGDNAITTIKDTSSGQSGKSFRATTTSEYNADGVIANVTQTVEIQINADGSKTYIYGEPKVDVVKSSNDGSRIDGFIKSKITAAINSNARAEVKGIWHGDNVFFPNDYDANNAQYPNPTKTTTANIFGRNLEINGEPQIMGENVGTGLSDLNPSQVFNLFQGVQQTGEIKATVGESQPLRDGSQQTAKATTFTLNVPTPEGNTIPVVVEGKLIDNVPNKTAISEVNAGVDRTEVVETKPAIVITGIKFPEDTSPEFAEQVKNRLLESVNANKPSSYGISYEPVYSGNATANEPKISQANSLEFNGKVLNVEVDSSVKPSVMMQTGDGTSGEPSKHTYTDATGVTHSDTMLPGGTTTNAQVSLEILKLLAGNDGLTNDDTLERSGYKLVDSKVNSAANGAVQATTTIVTANGETFDATIEYELLTKNGDTQFIAKGPIKITQDGVPVTNKLPAGVGLALNKMQLSVSKAQDKIDASGRIGFVAPKNGFSPTNQVEIPFIVDGKLQTGSNINLKLQLYATETDFVPVAVSDASFDVSEIMKGGGFDTGVGRFSHVNITPIAGGNTRKISYVYNNPTPSDPNGQYEVIKYVKVKYVGGNLVMEPVGNSAGTNVVAPLDGSNTLNDNDTQKVFKAYKNSSANPLVEVPMATQSAAKSAATEAAPKPSFVLEPQVQEILDAVSGTSNSQRTITFNLPNGRTISNASSAIRFVPAADGSNAFGLGSADRREVSDGITARSALGGYGDNTVVNVSEPLFKDGEVVTTYESVSTKKFGEKTLTIKTKLEHTLAKGSNDNFKSYEPEFSLTGADGNEVPLSDAAKAQLLQMHTEAAVTGLQHGGDNVSVALVDNAGSETLLDKPQVSYYDLTSDERDAVRRARDILYESSDAKINLNSQGAQWHIRETVSQAAIELVKLGYHPDDAGYIAAELATSTSPRIAAVREAIVAEMSAARANGSRNPISDALKSGVVLKAFAGMANDFANNPASAPVERADKSISWAEVSEYRMSNTLNANTKVQKSLNTYLARSELDAARSSDKQIQLSPEAAETFSKGLTNLTKAFGEKAAQVLPPALLGSGVFNIADLVNKMQKDLHDKGSYAASDLAKLLEAGAYTTGGALAVSEMLAAAGGIIAAFGAVGTLAAAAVLGAGMYHGLKNATPLEKGAFAVGMFLIGMTAPVSVPVATALVAGAGFGVIAAGLEAVGDKDIDVDAARDYAFNSVFPAAEANIDGNPYGVEMAGVATGTAASPTPTPAPTPEKPKPPSNKGTTEFAGEYSDILGAVTADGYAEGLNVSDAGQILGNVPGFTGVYGAPSPNGSSPNGAVAPGIPMSGWGTDPTSGQAVPVDGSGQRVYRGRENDGPTPTPVPLGSSGVGNQSFNNYINNNIQGQTVYNYGNGTVAVGNESFKNVTGTQLANLIMNGGRIENVGSGADVEILYKP